MKSCNQNVIMYNMDFILEDFGKGDINYDEIQQRPDSEDSRKRRAESLSESAFFIITKTNQVY